MYKKRNPCVIHTSVALLVNSFLSGKRHYNTQVYVTTVAFLRKYRSGKCVSSTFLASRGTGTSMNALDVEVNSRLWQCPQTRKEEMSPVMLLLADLAQSYRL